MKSISVILAILTLSVSAHASLIKGQTTFDFPSTTPSEENWPKIDWTGFLFVNGKKTVNPSFGAGDWNIRVKSGYLSTNKGSVCKVEDKSMGDVKQAPSSSECKYMQDEKYDVTGPAPEDMYNKSLMDWLTYVFSGNGCSHIFALHPSHPIFVLKTATGNFVKIKFTDSVKLRKRVTDTGFLGIGATCEDVAEPVSVYAADRVYVKIEYVYNTVVGDTQFE